MDYNSNNGGWIVVTHYLENSNKYGTYQMKVFHFRNCPPNTTAVSAGGGDTPYLVYCKPQVTGYEATPCDNGCNSNSGSVSIGH